MIPTAAGDAMSGLCKQKGLHRRYSPFFNHSPEKGK
jgi:hypothetical protein